MRSTLLLLVCSFLALTSAAGSATAQRLTRQTTLSGERRQIFRDEVDHLKGVNNRPVETGYGFYDPQEEQYDRPQKPAGPTYQDNYGPEFPDIYRPPTYQDNYQPPYQDVNYQSDEYKPTQPEDYKPAYEDDYKPNYQIEQKPPPYQEYEKPNDAHQPNYQDDYKPSNGDKPFYQDDYKPPYEDKPSYQADFKPSYDNKPFYQDDYRPPYEDKPSYQGDSKPFYQDDYKPPYDDDYKLTYDDVYKPAQQDDYKPTYDDKFPAFDADYKPDFKPINFNINFYDSANQQPGPAYGDNQYQQEEEKPYVPPPYEDYEPVEPVPEKPYKPVAPKPYKPRPTYPKEVILLQPSPALKASVYADKYTTPDYRPTSVPGTAGQDYPNYSSVPETSFDCLNQRNVDYSYMFADREAGCQVFHSCHADGRQDSFLCPLGTIFDYETQTCDWWFNARCY